MKSGSYIVKVKPNKRSNSIEILGDNILSVTLKEKAEKGKANKQLVNYLKKQTGFQCKILSGHNSKTKKISLF